VLLRDLPSANYYYINGGAERGEEEEALNPWKSGCPQAGPQTIAVTFILKSSPVDDLVQRFQAVTAI
jgi:hypothetical protein